MRGRKPKPVEKQIQEGDPGKHGKRILEKRLDAGPKAARGLPICPSHLKGRARAAWAFWSDELKAMKLDKRPDGPMLEGACRAYERAVQADLILDEEGIIVRENFINDEGEAIVLRVKKHPAVEISNRSWTLVKAFCSEFGLSPVSRIRLSVINDSEPESDLMALLSQPRASQGKPLVQ